LVVLFKLRKANRSEHFNWRLYESSAGTGLLYQEGHDGFENDDVKRLKRMMNNYTNNAYNQ
jgi:hypothetical protein